MSSDSAVSFNRTNLDKYLSELGKEYRKLGGKRMPAEIILIGGASVLVNYGFRDSTTDIDAFISAASTMKEAINRVADRCGLPDNWLNADFKRTESYSVKILQYSVYYKTFAGVLTVRTIAGEYLIAMKLRAGRKYKFDLSDVIGILADHKRNDKVIMLEDIKRAAAELYGSWEKIPEFSRIYITEVFKNGDFETMLTNISKEERANREELIDNGWSDALVITEKNASDILAALKKED